MKYCSNYSFCEPCITTVIVCKQAGLTRERDIFPCLKCCLYSIRSIMSYFVKLTFLAHLSLRRAYSIPMFRRRCCRRCCRRRQPFSKIFSSETAWPIIAKFYVEPPWEGVTKVCINGPGHMTKMAATPIYGKNL